MADSSRELLEMILRDCAAAGDKPWYPSDYAQAAGVDRSRLDASLDELRLGGLLHFTDWVQGKGQGYALTDTGRELVHTPRLLGQVRAKGVPVRTEQPERQQAGPDAKDWDRSKALRDALTTPGQPVVTRILITLNVINFAIGLLWTVQAGVPYEKYLGWGTNDATISQIRFNTGAMHGRESLLQGEWWRLVTYCFVHSGGLLHLFMNMWALYVLGPPLERVFGRFRFAWLYLLSGVGGGLAAVYFNPSGGLAGASGAICGLLGAFLAWVWLNRAYLQRSSEMLRSTMMNVILLVLISTMPDVSASGHFGGGVVGLALAIALNFNCFGKREQRWLGLAGALLITALTVGFAYYESVPHSDVEDARLTLSPKILRMYNLVAATNNEFVVPFLKRINAEKKVSAALKKQTFEAIDTIVPKLAAFEEVLAATRTYQDARVVAALEIGAEYFRKWQQYLVTVKTLADPTGNFVTDAVPKLNSLHSSINTLQKQLLEDSVLAK